MLIIHTFSAFLFDAQGQWEMSTFLNSIVPALLRLLTAFYKGSTRLIPGPRVWLRVVEVGGWTFLFFLHHSISNSLLMIWKSLGSDLTRNIALPAPTGDIIQMTEATTHLILLFGFWWTVCHWKPVCVFPLEKPSTCWIASSLRTWHFPSKNEMFVFLGRWDGEKWRCHQC